jgi:hypothetical protein
VNLILVRCVHFVASSELCRARSAEFMCLIGVYAIFYFTSLGSNVDNSINTRDGPYVLR